LIFSNGGDLLELRFLEKFKCLFMKAICFLKLILLLSLFIFSGCKKNDDIEVVPVFLIDFSEYSLTSNQYSASNIKSYFEGSGLTDVAALAKYDIKVFKVNYKTSFKGDSITASGLLAVPIPKEKSDAFPLLSYQHSTITSNAQSPTVNPQAESTSIVLYMASTGFIVMIPDYIGYGSSSGYFHPFMIRQYSDNAVLDFIRASKEFIATEKPCKTNNKLFLSGYSEGGSASMSALNAIENDPRNSDIVVTATACGAGIYNLSTFRSWMVGRPKYDQPYIIAYLLESFKRYSNQVIDDSLVFSNEYATLVPEMFDGVRSGDQINEIFNTLSVGELFNDNFEHPDTIFNNDKNYTGLRAAFSENSISAWSLKSDVTLFYGKSDMWVPGEQSLKIYSEFRTQGATSRIKIDAIDGQNHNGALIPTLARSISWFKKY
jgi:hypothetical protein